MDDVPLDEMNRTFAGAKPDTSHFVYFESSKSDISHFEHFAGCETGHLVVSHPDTTPPDTLRECLAAPERAVLGPSPTRTREPCAPPVDADIAFCTTKGSSRF